MQTFLATINYKTQELLLLNKSKNINIIDNEKFYLLFNGTLFNSINKIELLAKAYEEKGITFLQELEGSFSLIIYDKEKKQLFIAKDKIGIQPLYYSQGHESFVFGTHLQDFDNTEEIQLTINPNSLANYLQFGFVLQPNTIFKDCYKVQSGEYILCDINTTSYSSHNYWKLESCYNQEKHISNEKETLYTAHELLKSSIAQNTRNTQYGVALSGGYDSSTLVAIAQAQSNTKINTFTIGFHHNEMNEAPYAKEVAKHLGTNHNEHYFTAKDALELIPKICEVYDEPFADHASSPTMLTAQLLKKNNIDNLIAGDGGDEVFATAADVHTFERLKKVPYLLKQFIAQPLKKVPIDKIPYLKNHNNFPNKYNKLMKILLAKNIPQMIQARNTLFLEKELHLHIKDYNKPILTSFDKINFQGSAESVDEIIGTYFKTTMVDGELIKSYASMNHQNIKLSTPYLNTELVDYMAKVPSSIKIKNGTKKYLLKEIAYQYIPKELIERPKCGFNIPFGSWMKNELKEILYSQINKERLDKDNIFYTASILNIRNQFYAGNDAYKYKLWRIFIFQLWYEHFTSKKSKG
ncbi:MAG: Asparagine synthetase [glutamine-hydrolyzing] (EC [uncultured Sulfurovum sp.]|uniref:asparagine synthase (glutamine-hydrolyzing) n=1 Tax=uncultured Sulfurovum sp. TaxID=269237 RepID=A0A6S6S4S0_9BACT|nr:MAG: Asparagine synthetase [glutamine-hydrolyzing] (EC [uncultured Sulfurovum sp.]